MLWKAATLIELLTNSFWTVGLRKAERDALVLAIRAAMAVCLSRAGRTKEAILIAAGVRGPSVN